MSLPWSAEQREWLRALGHPVLMLANDVSAEELATDDIGVSDTDEAVSSRPRGREAVDRHGVARTGTGRAWIDQTGIDAASIDPAGVDERETDESRPRQPPAGAAIRGLHRALLRATGQRTTRAAEAALARLGVDTVALRGDSAAKRALWTRLRALRRSPDEKPGPKRR